MVCRGLTPCLQMSFAGSVGDARRVAVGPGSQFHKATRGFPGRLRVAFRSLAMRSRWSGDTWRQFLRCLSTSPEVRVQGLCALITDEPQECHRGRATECSADHVSCLISRRHVRIDRRDATTGASRLTLGQWIQTVTCCGAVASTSRHRGRPTDGRDDQCGGASRNRRSSWIWTGGMHRLLHPMMARQQVVVKHAVDGILGGHTSRSAPVRCSRGLTVLPCGISFRYASFLGCQECHASDRSGAGRGSPSWSASRRAGARDAGGSGSAGLVFVGVRSGKVLARDAAAASGGG